MHRTGQRGKHEGNKEEKNEVSEGNKEHKEETHFCHFPS